MKFNPKEKKIGLLGDVIIDKYKYFKALRLSPEGPAPVVKFVAESLSIGGAGNVAISISNLGLDVEINFAESKKQEIENKDFFKESFNKKKIKFNKIYSNLKNVIPTKIRYYVDGKQFMREDIEENYNKFENDFLSKDLINNLVSKYDILVISDYQKGLITNNNIKNIILNCNLNNIPLFIDTKIKEIDSLKNAFCLKINETEFNSLFEKFKIKVKDSIEDIHKKIELARKSANITNLVVTLGSKGSIFSNPIEVMHVISKNVDVVDITGAGDAFLSALTYSYMKRNGSNLFDINNNFIKSEDLEFANNASCSVIVSKGTVPISRRFIEIQNINSLKNKKVGFTNGCFDILHLGHLSLFKKAKSKCDYLIVGLNSDSSIKKLKGQDRPFNDEETRREILKSIKYIDEVIIFNENDPMRLIKEISPDLLVKGEDYEEDQIVGSDFVKSYGGEVMRVKIVLNNSTSGILRKIKNIN